MTDRESFQQPVNIGAHEAELLKRQAEEVEQDVPAEDKPKRAAKAKAKRAK